MKVASLLEQRRRNWHDLEQLCTQIESRRKRALGGPTVTRFASLYRSACADLALADAYNLPTNTVSYLHQLVGRAHNQLYRSRTFHVAGWLHELLVAVPQRLYQDNALRLAFLVFWGAFLTAGMLAYRSADFREQVLGKDFMTTLEEMHIDSASGTNPQAGSIMVGFYIQHNTSIGLQCFASGLLLGVGGLFTTLFNAISLGAAFGFMATIRQQTEFFQFVTAHGPFELNAIVLSAAAGMRLGFSMIDTQGLSRGASLRRATREAVPTMAAAAILFALAAMIEAMISPSAAPYWVKALVAVLSTGILLIYFVLLGYPRQADDSTR